jgi:large subunit ribosomal protein L18
MNIQKAKLAQKTRRKARVRAKISGTEARPRLAVARTLNHIYVQLINDETSRTLVYVSDAKVKGDAGDRKGKIAKAYLAGKELAEAALKKGVKEVVFDRAHRKYHGRVKAVADGARDGGLKF